MAHGFVHMEHRLVAVENDRRDLSWAFGADTTRTACSAVLAVSREIHLLYDLVARVRELTS